MTDPLPPDRPHHPKSPMNHTERHLALRVVPMPRDTNPLGTIFGGVILSFIDQAGFVEARRHGLHRWVTASIERVDFIGPVRLGDVVNLYSRTLRTGRTSVTVEVSVEAEHADTGLAQEVTTATMTLVAVDRSGNPIPFVTPPTATGV